MCATQIAEMEFSIGEVYRGIHSPDDEPAACCTLEAVNASSSEVWIQVMPGTINMAYPFADEPLALLLRQGVFSPPDIYLIDWKAGEYATFGFSNIYPRDHAYLVDQLFVKVLGCDDATYQLRTAIEAL